MPATNTPPRPAGFDAVLELRMVVQRAEAASLALNPAADFPAMDDFRTEWLSHLFDAMDRIEPGLGMRMLFAMYPRASGAQAADRRRHA